jgi:hypothetical protein
MFTSFLCIKSSIEFCASLRNRFILASIVWLHEFARFIWVSKTDFSREDEEEFENERDEFINESVGKNPRK